MATAVVSNLRSTISNNNAQKRWDKGVRNGRTWTPEEGTYQSIKNVKLIVTIIVEYAATDNVCNLLFLGTFAGTDKQLNILLINTDEYRLGPDADSDGQGGRYVGQVMIPWRLVVRVETQAEGEHSRGINYHDSDEDSMYA